MGIVEYDKNESNRQRKYKGLTLIELMVVIAIIVILAAVLVPNLLRARREGALSACEQNMKNISTAVEMYNVDNYTYPSGAGKTVNSSSFPELVNPKYLRAAPTCPSNKGQYYIYYSASSTSYSIACPNPNAHRNILNNTLYYESGKGFIKD